jgi:hypothetical protein
MKTAVEWLFEQVVNKTERVYFLKEELKIAGK